MSSNMPRSDGDLVPRIALLLERQGVACTAGLTGFHRVFGGNARQAWAFDIVSSSGPEAGARPCILLSQVPGGHVESDVSVEYGFLAALTGSGIKVPAAIALDAEGVVTGAPAVVMERLPGEASAVKFLSSDHADASRNITRELAETTADLHLFDWRRSGLPCPDEDPVAALIGAWEARYLEHRPAPHPPLSFIFSWLQDNRPDHSGLSLVHGDLRPGNFLYEGASLTSLLDWEMAHIGDPAEDIAWIYRDLWSPARFLSLEEFVAIYEQRAGYEIGTQRLRFYRVFSEAKFATLSVVASTSFMSGKTGNLRHADRASKVAASVDRCLALIGEADHEARRAAA